MMKMIDKIVLPERVMSLTAAGVEEWRLGVECFRRGVCVSTVKESWKEERDSEKQTDRRTDRERKRERKREREKERERERKTDLFNVEGKKWDWSFQERNGSKSCASPSRSTHCKSKSWTHTHTHTHTYKHTRTDKHIHFLIPQHYFPLGLGGRVPLCLEAGPNSILRMLRPKFIVQIVSERLLARGLCSWEEFVRYIYKMEERLYIYMKERKERRKTGVRRKKEGR